MNDKVNYNNSFKIIHLIFSDLKQIKDTKKQFDRITNELDNAFVKNADAPKNKPIVCDEMERNLLGIKKSFGHSSLEYICLLNKFYLGRSHSILDMVGFKFFFIKKCLNDSNLSS